VDGDSGGTGEEGKDGDETAGVLLSFSQHGPPGH